MKKKVIFLLLLSSTFNLNAKNRAIGKIDPPVENKFKKEFGSSVKVSWEIIQDIYVGTFVDHEEEKQVYYSSDGEILGLGKIINKELLPPITQRSINTRFNSGIIKTVYEFKSRNSPTLYYTYLITRHYLMIVSANEFGDIEIIQKIRSKEFHITSADFFNIQVTHIIPDGFFERR